MNWIDRVILRRAELINVKRKVAEEMNTAKSYVGGGLSIDLPRQEGEDRITFELTTAVGGKILNVRRYDRQRDRHETQTYVIPNGEDLSERIVKILNLEAFK
jgi:hypothetical protein